MPDALSARLYDGERIPVNLRIEVQQALDAYLTEDIQTREGVNGTGGSWRHRRDGLGRNAFIVYALGLVKALRQPDVNITGPGAMNVVAVLNLIDPPVPGEPSDKIPDGWLFQFQYEINAVLANLVKDYMPSLGTLLPTDEPAAVTERDVLEEETQMPIGTRSLIPCARHNGLQHRHEVILDETVPANLGMGLWHCIDPEPDKERLFEANDQPLRGGMGRTVACPVCGAARFNIANTRWKMVAGCSACGFDLTNHVTVVEDSSVAEVLKQARDLIELRRQGEVVLEDAEAERKHRAGGRDD